MNSAGCYSLPFHKKDSILLPSLGGRFQVANARTVDILLSHVSCGFGSLSSAPRARPTQLTPPLPQLLLTSVEESKKPVKGSGTWRFVTLSLVDLQAVLS